MSGYVSATERTSELTMPEFHQPSRVRLSHVGWPIPTGNAGFTPIQDVRLLDDRMVGADGCDIADAQKFSTQVGPPLCSPPV